MATLKVLAPISSPGTATLAVSTTATQTESKILGLTLLPGFDLVAGSTFKIHAYGSLTSGATAGGCTIRVRVGPTTLVGSIITSISATNVKNATNAPFEFSALIACRSVGAGGTIIGGSYLGSDGTAFPPTTRATNATTVAINTTTSNQMELTCQSAASTVAINFAVAYIDLVKV